MLKRQYVLTRSSLLTGDDHLAEPILLIGIGNDYRSDDAAGLVVARMLQQRMKGKPAAAPAASSADSALDERPMTIIEHSGEGTTLLEAWRGWERVILVDAVCSGAPPGTIQRFDASARTIPASLFAASSHAFGVAQGIELARALGQLPRLVLLYGIEGKTFAAGATLSPEVEQAALEVVKMIASAAESASLFS